MATVAAKLIPDDRLFLTEVSWDFYEHTLAEIGNRQLRVSFLDGDIEIMSPLPEHDAAKKAIGRLIEMLSFLIRMPCKSFGSTTFRYKKKTAGTEPDECYYFSNIDRVKGMKRFDAGVQPAPDLVVEVDLMSASISRETIFARLEVPEIWRYADGCLTIRNLSEDQTYVDVPNSRWFPSLPITGFAEFIQPMIDEEETAVLAKFEQWVRGLPHS